MVVIDANSKCIYRILTVNEIKSASLRQHHAENNNFMEYEFIALFKYAV